MRQMLWIWRIGYDSKNVEYVVFVNYLNMIAQLESLLFSYRVSTPIITKIAIWII